MAAWSRSRITLQAVALATGALLSVCALAEDKVVFQVTENDASRWNLILNNVRNLQAGASADADVEIVAYGPGIQMLKGDSAVAARIADTIGHKVRVVACENSMAGAKLTKADMLPDVGYVPAGVVEVMRRQQQGYAYIRP